MTPILSPKLGITNVNKLILLYLTRYQTGIIFKKGDNHKRTTRQTSYNELLNPPRYRENMWLHPNITGKSNQ